MALPKLLLYFLSVNFLPDLLEKGVLYGFSGSDSERVVDREHASQQIEEALNGVRRLKQVLILVIDELIPGLLFEILQLVIDLRH